MDNTQEEFTSTRTILVNEPGDEESEYSCKCGFDQFLGKYCECLTCRHYDSTYGLPLVRCPECNTQFTVKES